MRIKSCLVVLYLFGALFVRAATSRGASPAEQVEFSYELKNSTVSLHEPVVLIFKVHNGLEKPVTLELGINWVQFFEFSLVSPRGRSIQGHAQRSQGLSTQPGELVIEPGQGYQQELLLNQWFDFDLAGQYFLTATLNTPIRVGEMAGAAPQGSHLSLEVKPRDAVRLTRVCSELAKKVEMANGGEAEQKPLLELSYVRDPVAVPYLAEVLLQHRINYGAAISGLERIGNDAAVEALLSVLGDSYADMADSARQALTRMQNQISNPNLKETVKRELAVKRG